MRHISYEQARQDHEYLWETWGPAEDMTGAYVDQEDLSRLLRSPTKATARDCYVSQIVHWFNVGPETAGVERVRREELAEDETVLEIAERYGCGLP